MPCQPTSPALRTIFALFAICLAGCGTPAAPLPPSLNLPTPVLNLSAARSGSVVQLYWTMPTRTTDKIVLRNRVDTQVCRAVEGGPCASIAHLSLEPGKAGAYADTLPSDLREGAARLLRYEVAVRNRAGKSAGPSNPAYSAAGASPAPFTGVQAEVRADGVLLSWMPVPQPGGSMTFRIQRLDTTAANAEPQPKSLLAPPTPAAAQTLAVETHGGADPGHAIDPSALFNRQYRYVMERVLTLHLDGHAVEVQGPPSEEVRVDTQDRFAPAVPAGLAAVADSAGGAIDLSWTPNTESDLAAYHVYRRDTQGGGVAQPIAVVKGETSFRDSSVQREHTYAYSLSASDQSSNESARSPEVEETLAAQ